MLSPRWDLIGSLVTAVNSVSVLKVARAQAVTYAPQRVRPDVRIRPAATTSFSASHRLRKYCLSDCNRTVAALVIPATTKAELNRLSQWI